MRDRTTQSPIVAITLGDAGGIGPEIAVKAAVTPKVREVCRPLLVGPYPVVEEALEETDLKGEVEPRIVEEPENLDDRSQGIAILNTRTLKSAERTKGRVSVVCGRAAAEDTRIATELALAGTVHAVTSGPVNKQGLQMAGYNYSGQTEYFQHLTDAESTFTLLVGGPMRVALLSTHVSLRDAIGLVTRARVANVVTKLDEALREAFGIADPRIGVSGLNPHSGDDGLMGREEVDEVTPALEDLRRAGIDVSGPVPADAFFLQGDAGHYDGMLALYHDQGVIPLKRHAYATFAYGLPILRTTAGHGTAYDIAGTGRAEPTAMINAVVLAASIFANRRRKDASRTDSQ